MARTASRFGIRIDTQKCERARVEPVAARAFRDGRLTLRRSQSYNESFLFAGVNDLSGAFLVATRIAKNGSANDQIT